VPHGGALRVVLSPRADDLDDFFLEQLGEYAEPDPDAQGDPSSARGRHPLRPRSPMGSRIAAVSRA